VTIKLITDSITKIERHNRSVKSVLRSVDALGKQRQPTLERLNVKEELI